MPLARRRAVAAALVAVVFCLVAATGASAQDPGPTLPTLPGQTTTTDPAATTSTSQPIEPEDPGASVPPSDVTVPPQDQDPTAPTVGKAVPLDLDLAVENASAAERTLADATARRLIIEQQIAGLNLQIGTLAAAEQAAIAELAAAQDQLRRRAVRAYVHGGEDPAKLIPEDDSDPLEYAQRLTLVAAVLESDQRAIERYREAKKRASEGQVITAQQVADAAAALQLAFEDELKASANVVDAQFVLGVARVGGTLAIHGFVFPVAPPYSFRNDWGDPRNAGTELAHPHRGNDIAAAQGQPLLACERGVITQLGESGLGGTQLFLRGASGTVYYYAHLSAYADGLRVGQLVEPNEVIGFVGQTGSAFGPHLHFQIHPGGGEPINPYPILVAADPTNSHPPV